MHSRIFQITKERVDKNCRLNENTLTQGDGSNFDYCSEISKEVRKEDIIFLVEKMLPKGMFTLTSDDTMRYNGGTEQWKEDFIANIRNKAAAITPDNMLEWIGPVYQLEQALKDPLCTGYQFYTDENGLEPYAEQSYEFMRWVCTLTPGTTLYIGGVIDYHF